MSHRGDIVWAELNPTTGREQRGFRPVLIISENVFNNRSETVIALALTSKKQRVGFPLTHKLPHKILGKTAWVKISQIRILSVDRLGKTISHLEEDELQLIIDGLNEIIGGS